MVIKGPNDKVILCSVAQSCLALCDAVDSSTPGFPVLHRILQFAQTHVHRVGDAVQPSHPLSSPSPLAFNLSQHQGLFQWVSSSHQVARVLEFQLQHQSFQWIFRTAQLSLIPRPRGDASCCTQVAGTPALGSPLGRYQVKNNTPVKEQAEEGFIPCNK